MTRALREKNRWNAGDRDGRYEAAMRLFGTLSGVDEDYLAACEADTGAGAAAGSGRGGAIFDPDGSESGNTEKKASFGMARFVWKYGRAMAAVLCIAVLGVSYLSFRIGVFSGGTKEYASGSANGGSNTTMEMGTASDSAACDTGLCGVAAGKPESAEEEACVSVEDESLSEKMTGESVPAGASAEVPDREEGLGGSWESAESDRSSSGTAPFEQAKEQHQSDTKQESEDYVEGLCSLRDPSGELTLEEARALAVVGGYLPRVWPAEGRIGSVRKFDGEGLESVALTWGYDNEWDHFTLSVTDLGDAMPAGIEDFIVDKSKPETYDQRIYEIPYADTVPAEYRAVSGNPVFWQEDFDRECVAARVLPAVDDGGDTGTPRGNFSVLYRTEEGGYVLVKFSGRGSVDEIWTLIRSIP